MSIRIIAFMSVFLNCILIFSQKSNLTKNENSENILTEIAKSGKYDLVGDFFVAQKKPLKKLAKVFKKYKGWGYIDENGNEVIETKYIFLTDFQDGICKATYTAQRKHPRTGNLRNVDLTGLLDVNGILLTYKDYDDITFYFDYNNFEPFFNPHASIVTTSGNKKGLIDKSGVEIITAEFDDILSLKKVTAIKNNSKWALINKEGKQLTDFIFDYINEHKNFLFGQQDGARYLLNQDTGERLSDVKININYNFSDQDNNTDYGNDMDAFIVRSGERYTLLRKDGKTIITAKYLGKSSDEYYTIKNDKNFGLMNSSGKLVIDSIYKDVGVAGKDDRLMNFYARKHDDSVVYFTKDYKKIPIVAENYHVQNGRIVFSKNGKWGIMDESGKILIKPIYDMIDGFESYDYTTAKTDNFRKNGIISRDGKIISPFIYDQIYDYQSKNMIVVSNNKYGLINHKGKSILPTIYKSIESFFDSEGNYGNYFIAKGDNLTQLITPDKKVIISDLKGGFSEIKQFFRNQRRVFPFQIKANKEGETERLLFGLKDTNAKIITKPEYESITVVQNGIACAQPLNPNHYRPIYILLDTFGNKLTLDETNDSESRSVTEYHCTKPDAYHDRWHNN